MYLENNAPKMSEDRRDGPDEKIRRTAFELFYRQGYHATGINQIIEESGTSKKSFYRYFPGKEDLARVYLGDRKKFYLEFFRKLARRCPELRDFLNTWMFVLKKEVECDRYYGCAFANFAGQTMEAPSVFLTDLREVVHEWREILREYLGGCVIDGKAFTGNPRRAADRILLVYEGTVQLYAMTRETHYVENMGEEIMRLL